MSFVVEGSLGGPFGPWLARGPEGPVVLRRRAGALCATGHGVVADAFAQVELEGVACDVEPYVAGLSLDGAALRDGDRRAVLCWVARGLSALHGRGVGHGAVGSGRVRVGVDGTVRLVGALRGDPAADAHALATLASELWDEIPADVAARLEEGQAAWASAPAGFLPAQTGPEEPVLQAHSLVGQRFALDAPGASAASERPPKVQAAMFAAVTLILGLLAGSFLAGCSDPPGPPVEVTVHVPGAIQISAHCGGETTYRTQGANQDTLTFQTGVGDTTTCELEAPLSPVMPLRGQLLLSRDSWTYRCDRDGVVLVCHDVEARAKE